MQSVAGGLAAEGGGRLARQLVGRFVSWLVSWLAAWLSRWLSGWYSEAAHGLAVAAGGFPGMFSCTSIPGGHSVAATAASCADASSAEYTPSPSVSSTAASSAAMVLPIRSYRPLDRWEDAANRGEGRVLVQVRVSQPKVAADPASCALIALGCVGIAQFCMHVDRAISWPSSILPTSRVSYTGSTT